MSKKDLNELAKEFKRRGWSVTPTKGDHLKWTHTESGKVVISSQTPSDHKVKLNVRSYLLRKEREARQEKQDMLSSTSASTGKVPAIDSFVVRIAYYRTGGAYGIIMSLPGDAITIQLQSLDWKLAVSDRNLILYQASDGNKFNKISATRYEFKINARRIDHWPLDNYQFSHPMEDCRAVLAQDAGGKSTIRIALPSWLRKWYDATRAAEMVAETVVKAPPQEAAPVLQSAPSPLAFAAVMPAVSGRKPKAVKPKAAVAPVPAPAPAPVSPTPVPQDANQSWRDACALCDMINEHLDHAPATIEFFWDNGRLGVKRVTVEEYRPKR